MALYTSLVHVFFKFVLKYLPHAFTLNEIVLGQLKDPFLMHVHAK